MNRYQLNDTCCLLLCIKHCFIVSLLMCSISLIAQPATSFSKKYGTSFTEKSVAIQANASNDGLILLANSTNTSQNNGMTDYNLLKLDEQGNQQWSKFFGANQNENASAFTSTSDGGYLIAGVSYSPSLSSNFSDKGNFWIVKTNAEGNLLWQKSYGGSGFDSANQIIQANDGGYLIGGISFSTDDNEDLDTYGNGDFRLIKIDEQGAILWQKIFGGSRSETLTDLLQVEDGYILAGNTFSRDGDLIYSNGQSDAWILKINNTGDIQWSQVYGGIANDEVNSIAPTYDGGFVATGKKGTIDLNAAGIQPDYDEDLWVFKIDASGNTLWSKELGGSKFDFGNDVIQLLDGNILVAGNTFSNDQDVQGHKGRQDAWLIQFSNEGELQWKKIYGGSGNDEATAIFQLPNGAINIAGNSDSKNGDITQAFGNADTWLLQLLGEAPFFVNLGQDYSVCENSLITMNAASIPCFACTYLWNDDNTEASRTLIPFQTTTYSVTVTSQTGEQASDQITITVNNNPEISLETQAILCSDSNDGLITTNIISGAAPYNYDWNTGTSGTDFIENLSPDSYEVTVTDANGCSTISSETLTAPEQISLTFNQQNLSCFNTTDGAIEVLAEGGTGDYNYQWNIDQSTSTITDLEAGTYELILTDANDCPANLSIEITAPPAILIEASVSNILCNGANNGSIATTVEGGEGTLIYNWSNGANKNSISNLSEGDYQLIITDENNCTQAATYTIEESPAIEINFEIEKINCNGESNGAIALDVSGGNGGYSYEWEDATMASSLTDLSIGIYEVTVIDFNACEASISIEIEEPDAIEYIPTFENVTCFGANDGVINLDVSGGNGAYDYNWEGINLNEANIANLSSGIYEVTITDANDCTINTSIEITEPDVLQIASSFENVTCNGEANGSILLNVVGGIEPYEYGWNNESEEDNLEDLFADIYTVTITDANECTEEKTIEISEPPILEITTEASMVNCAGGADASINTFPTGGTAPYSIIWNTGSDSENLDSLSIGIYTATVVDNNNCTTFVETEITEPISINFWSSVSDVNCYGEATGAITISPGGGTAPYAYKWSNESNSNSITNVNVGDYQLTITDANDCEVMSSFIINQPDSIVLSSIVNDVSCAGENDGTIEINTEGGTSPYFYNWSNEAGENQLENLTADNYSLTLTDDNNCQEIVAIEIQEPTAIESDYEVNPISCFNINDGSIQVNAMGGTGELNIIWNTNNNDTNILTDLSEGLYKWTITDDNNCQYKDSLFLTKPPDILIDFETELPLCFGDNTGSATALASGGTGDFEYVWAIGVTNNQLENFPSATYQVTVIDENNCTVTDSVFIDQPASLNPLFNSFDVSCYGLNDGMISLGGIGGIGPYQFLWASGDTLSQLNNLPPATYNISITDANDCQEVFSVPIMEPDSIFILVDTIQPLGGEFNGSIQIAAFGGVGPYNYLWDDGTTGNSLEDIGPGDYTVEVIDDNGCSYIDVITLSPITSIKQSLLANQIKIFPNPTSDLLNIKLENNNTDLLEIEVYNNLGKYIISDQCTNLNDCIIDFQQYPAGMYYLKLKQTNQIAFYKITIIR